MSNNPNNHNYLKEIARLHSSGQLGLSKAPGVTIVDVFHDAWCMSETGGVCNCEPEIRPSGQIRKPNRAERRRKKK